jgi:hypothetical protein
VDNGIAHFKGNEPTTVNHNNTNVFLNAKQQQQKILKTENIRIPYILKSKQDTLPYVHLYVYKMIKGTRR